MCSLKITILEDKALVIILKGFWCAGWCCTWDMNLCPLQCLAGISLCIKKKSWFEWISEVSESTDQEVRRHFPRQLSYLHFTDILSGWQHLFLKIRNCLCSLTSILCADLSNKPLSLLPLCPKAACTLAKDTYHESLLKGSGYTKQRK